MQRPARLEDVFGAVPPTTTGACDDVPEESIVGRDVLFAMKLTSRNVTHVARAVALAHALRGRLHVVCVVPPRAAAWGPLFPHEVSRALVDEATFKRDVFESAVWVRDMAPGCEVKVLAGAFATVTASLARAIGPRVVVVSREDLDNVRDATFLVRETGLPVLVARSVESGSTIVAATDLLHRELPVLRAAADLASAMEAPLVAVHNVPALTIEPLTATGVPVAVGPTPEDLSARARALEVAVRAIDPDATALIVSESQASVGILQQAREHDADLVVVGAYGGSWMERVLFGSTADDVLRSARRSVLVLPLARRVA